MAEDIGVLDGALPLIRGDNPWQQPVIFYTDDGITPLDLTGMTVEAVMRWRGGSQDVSSTITEAAAGAVTLSLTGDQTQNLPFGYLVSLFVQAIDGPETFTWFRAPIEVKEGTSS
jgi:hypothetical protein